MFNKTTLDNGITIISEKYPQSRAVSVGLWIKVGTRHEDPRCAGISHFLEHLVFKGTKTKTAYQIAKSLEALGGELNAHTTREYTCLNALVLADHWPKAMDVLVDLSQNMSLSQNDFEKEKSVVIQEIAMGEDELEELVFDIFLTESLPGSTLGLPILGVPSTLARLTLPQVKKFYKANYGGSNLIISAAGQINHDELVARTQKLFGRKKHRARKNRDVKPKYRRFKKCIEKPTEQLHLLAGLPCASFQDKFRFEAIIVNALLGGGMTSKLYQNVRERKGLVYSIMSLLYTFVDFGFLNIYAACEKKNMKKVIDSVIQEIQKLKKNGISENDLQMFKTQIEGNILLGADDMDNRMQSLGINEMVFKDYKPVDHIIDEIHKVTSKSIHQFIDRHLNVEQFSWLLVGGGAKSLEGHIKNLP